jgi:hypothetical protein
VLEAGWLWSVLLVLRCSITGHTRIEITSSGEPDGAMGLPALDLLLRKMVVTPDSAAADVNHNIITSLHCCRNDDWGKQPDQGGVQRNAHGLHGARGSNSGGMGTT